MAKIEFEAFVEDVKTDRDGNPFVLKTAETHSRKDDQGNWQTVARTFRDVKTSRESGVSLSGIGKGDRVTVTGSEKTEVREHEGKKFYTLVVWADTISRADGRNQGQGRAGSAETASTPDEPWGVPSGPQNASWKPDSDVPF